MVGSAAIYAPFSAPADDVERLNYGFRDLEILPIDNDFWRFYRLVP